MKNGRMVASRLPEDLVHDLELIEQYEEADRSTVIRRLLRRAVSDWKRDFYARQYGESKLTLARAAQEAGISLWEMMEYIRLRKIGVQYDMDDFRRDLVTMDAGGL